MTTTIEPSLALVQCVALDHVQEDGQPFACLAPATVWHEGRWPACDAHSGPAPAEAPAGTIHINGPDVAAQLRSVALSEAVRAQTGPEDPARTVQRAEAFHAFLRTAAQ